MPARSNEFQRLVRAIQGHLSRIGTVTESRMLPDRDTGSAVEVDIVIEEFVGSHQVLIGIECTAEKRKATIEWYREMRGKHKDLPITKTVLVAKSGFTREVLRKARKDNIELMTLGQAQSFNWNSLFSKLQDGTVADVHFPLRSLSLVASRDSEKGALENFDADTVIRFLTQELPLGQLVMEVAVQQGLTRAIMAELGEVLKKSDHFSFHFKLPPDAYIVVNERRIGIIEVQASLWIRPRFHSMKWQPVEVNGQSVATGTFPAEFLFPGTTGETVVTASGTRDDFKVTVLGPSDNDISLDVFPHALWPGTPTPRG